MAVIKLRQNSHNTRSLHLVNYNITMHKVDLVATEIHFLAFQCALGRAGDVVIYLAQKSSLKTDFTRKTYIGNPITTDVDL